MGKSCVGACCNPEVDSSFEKLTQFDNKSQKELIRKSLEEMN